MTAIAIEITPYLHHLDPWDTVPVVSTIFSGPLRILAGITQLVAGSIFALANLCYSDPEISRDYLVINMAEVSESFGNLLRGVIALVPIAGNLAIRWYTQRD